MIVREMLLHPKSFIVSAIHFIFLIGVFVISIFFINVYHGKAEAVKELWPQVQE